MFESLWQSRNKDYHELSSNEYGSASLRQKRMIDRVKSLYDEAQDMNLEDKNKIFPDRIKDVLEKRPKQMEAWIIDASKIVQVAFEQTETLDKHPITDYFPILTTNNPTPPPTHPTPRPLNDDHG